MIKPYGEIEINPKWNTVTVRFESGKKQKQRRQVNPDLTWGITFQGLNEEKEYLLDFFNRHSGDYLPFYFTINGVQHTVRFANDNLQIIEKRQLGEPVAYTCKLVLEKVYE